MIGAVALALVASGAAHAERAGVRWERTFEDAQKKAQAVHKPLMVDLWASWCGWCRRLDRTTYVDPRVVEYAEDFVPVKVNTEGGPREAAIALRYEVNNLPTILFVSPSGRLILRVEGFQGPGQFPTTLEQARELGVKIMGWETAIEKNPDDAAALLGLGAHLFDQESYAEARALLTRAAQRDGERPANDRKRARMLLGALLKSYDRNFPGAEQILKEGLTIQPAGDYDAKLLYVLGRTYISWGRQAEARAALQQILSTHGDSAIAEKARETLGALDRR